MSRRKRRNKSTRGNKRIDWVKKDMLLPYMELSVDDIFEAFENMRNPAVKVQWHDNETRHIFIDNGANVLLVAHLDTVKRPRLDTISKKKMTGAGFDDRLGAYLAIQFTQYRNVDILLTDHEEVGASTAQFFNIPERYNWIAEFDRAGEDVVTYGLDSTEWLLTLEDTFKIGMGAFSDVCFLETDACCVNVGIGYHKAHSEDSEDSYVMLDELYRQMNRFLAFYDAQCDTPYEMDYMEYESHGYDNGYECGYDNGYDNGYGGLYNHYGYPTQGYPTQGYDIHGYDKYGYDKHGYDRLGYDSSGQDRYKYNDLEDPKEDLYQEWIDYCNKNQ